MVVVVVGSNGNVEKKTGRRGLKNCVSCYRELVCLRPYEYAGLARQESVNLNGYNLLEKTH